jgi:hypothetical protein
MKQGNLPRVIAIALAISCLFVIVVSGCQSQPSGEIAVRVIVSQDFGNELMLDKSAIVNDGTAALDALEKVATVETKYGGGFVEAINGIRSQYSGSKVKKDWFFYVNGMSARVGGLSYKLRDGDVEHWDFHDWSFHAFVPAIIGDFPQPFLSGYQGKVLPTTIVYDEGFQEAAQHLINKLGKLGVENIHMAGPESSAYSKKFSNLILLGTKGFEPIAELNKNYGKLGFFIHFAEDKVARFDLQGNQAQYGSDCGLIQATQNPWNPKGIGACENVIWVVSGTNNAAVEDAAGALINHYEKFRYACAAVIIDGEVIKVPQ